MFGPANAALISLLTVFTNLVPVIIGLAVIFFLWGLAKYILKADDAEGRKSARQLMLWGVIIIFVMVSLWGLVRFVDSLFALTDTKLPGPQI
jgi:predicted Na+-dependent transporter